MTLSFSAFATFLVYLNWMCIVYGLWHHLRLSTHYEKTRRKILFAQLFDFRIVCTQLSSSSLDFPNKNFSKGQTPKCFVYMKKTNDFRLMCTLITGFVRTCYMCFWCITIKVCGAQNHTSTCTYPKVASQLRCIDLNKHYWNQYDFWYHAILWDPRCLRNRTRVNQA